jgi:hypothetical protein
MGICCEGSQGKTERVVVLKKKKKGRAKPVAYNTTLA